MSRKGDGDHHRRHHDTGSGPGGGISGSGSHYGGKRTFNVSVVGLSGTEKDKGCLGVGKSCLCNRFIRPQADQYNRDHISILSQTDFSGPIVNNEHWLYWGETRKFTDEGFDVTFSIVEQTEFVDDACFQPFRSGLTVESYHKRCAATRLTSAEKLMYICKNQLGIEKEYEQRYLPDGRFTVDGFVCVFDVSEIQGRSIERQIELTALILGSLLKTKKPVVLATTKNDEASDLYVREAEKLVNRREFKGLIPLVETSAHENVNVDLAFWACLQRDWPKGKTKILSYHEAFQRQRDRAEMVNDNYLSLIQSNITDYRTHWTNTYSNLSQSQDFITYCDLFGQESAQQTFKRHVKKLKDEYVCRKIDLYLRRLPKVFSQMLPDLESFGPDQSWPAVQQILHSHPLFDSHFVLNESLSWQEMDDQSELRIPFDLLSTPEAEKAFFDHLNSLLAEEHLRNLRYQFGELLRETAVLPGQPLKDIRNALKGRDCVDSLPEFELKSIYEEYQKMLQQDARDQLNELFLEHSPLFLQFASGKMLTQEDLSTISQELSNDERWHALDLLPQDRQLALIRHLGFLQWPIKEHCFAGQACVELNIEAYQSSLAKRNCRQPLWSQEQEKIQMKFVVIGSSAYAENLANVVKAMCPSLEQENPRIQYDLQTVPSNGPLGIFPFRAQTNPMQPEAYLCVYSSRSSLDYLLKTLEHSLFAGDQLRFGIGGSGLPIIMLLACTPDTSAKERNYLREEGTNRAQILQCAFFDVTSNEPHARFKSDELLRALIFVSETLMRRCEISQIYSPSMVTPAIPEGALNPEIRILISLMCGDPISLPRFLECLFPSDGRSANGYLFPVSDHSFVTDVGPMLLLDDDENPPIPGSTGVAAQPISNCYVEFVVSSYHSSYSYKEELFHGNILVYWSKRRASFSNMTALASVTSTLMPILILAVVENGPRPSKLSHQLVAKGQQLADQLQAHFQVTTLGTEMGKIFSRYMRETKSRRTPEQIQISNPILLRTTRKDLFTTVLPRSRPHQRREQLGAADIQDPSSGGSDHVSPSAEGMVPVESIYEKLPDEANAVAGAVADHGDHDDGLDDDPDDIPESLKNVGAIASLARERGFPMDRQLTRSELYLLLVDPEANSALGENVGRNSFAPGQRSNEEQLIKPSELRQKRLMAASGHTRQGNYYNLQSYPSADSLDRIYSIDAHYSNYYGGTGMAGDPSVSAVPMPSHYVYRPFVQRNMIGGNGEGQLPASPSAFAEPRTGTVGTGLTLQESPPPRPASSAHVMIPRESHHPPPYSRVAISPPPAYKMHHHYQHHSIDIPETDRLYSNYQPPLTDASELAEAAFERNTLGYYQRKYYPQINIPPEYSSSTSSSSAYRNPAPSSSPFSTCGHTFNDDNNNYEKAMAAAAAAATVDQLAMHHGGGGSYRNSPLAYATTGRNFHHHHQYLRAINQPPPASFVGGVRNLPHEYPSPLLLRQQHPPDYPPPSASSFYQRHAKKKKKKQSSKARSSSLQHRLSLSAEADEEDDDDDEENENGPRPTAVNKPSGDLENKPKRMYVRSRKKREIEKSNKTQINTRKKLPNNNNEMADCCNIKQERSDSREKSSSSSLSGRQDSEEPESRMGKHNNEQQSDSDDQAEDAAEEGEEEEEDEDQEGEEEEEESVPSSDAENDGGGGNEDDNDQDNGTSATAKLDAKADDYAVESSWEYHQQTHVPNVSSRNLRQANSWIPAAETADDVENRSRSPGRLDLKKYATLSDAIGRMNLHPTQMKSGGDGDVPSKKNDEQKMLRRPPVRQQSKPEPPSRITGNESDGEASVSNVLNEESSEASNINERIKFNSLKPAMGLGQKNKQRKRHVTPVPVAPPRLPSSANSSNAVTPTSSGAGKSFASFSTYDDSQQEKLATDPSDNEEHNRITNESRRIQRHQLSKLLSLPTDSESGINLDETSTDMVSEETSTSQAQSGQVTGTEKAKFFKSKSVGNSGEKKAKAEKKASKMEKKRLKEEERKNRKSTKEKGKISSPMSLEDYAQPNGNPVPLFLEKCTTFIEQFGMDMKGVYRVPGVSRCSAEVYEKFKENPDVNFIDLDPPINAITLGLKEFLLKMPPMFPRDTLEHITDLTKDALDTRSIAKIREFLRSLPNANYQVIKHIVLHMGKVSENHTENEMDCRNLAICFWPTMMQIDLSDFGTVGPRHPYLLLFVQLLFQFHEPLFKENEDGNDELNFTPEQFSSLF